MKDITGIIISCMFFFFNFFCLHKLIFTIKAFVTCTPHDNWFSAQTSITYFVCFKGRLPQWRLSTNENCRNAHRNKMALAEVCGYKPSSFAGITAGLQLGVSPTLLRDAEISSKTFTVPYNFDVRDSIQQ